MQVCAESSCAVDPPFHRALQRAAFQAVLVAHRERRSKARNACRAQSPSLHRRGPCTTPHKPASKEKALRAMRLAVLHFSPLPCSAPFFHSSLLVITIFAQIADGRNSTLHTTDGILDANYITTYRRHDNHNVTDCCRRQPPQHNSTTPTTTTSTLTCCIDFATTP